MQRFQGVILLLFTKLFYNFTVLITVNSVCVCVCVCVCVKSSQVTFIYIALLTIQIVTKQLHNIKMGK